MLVERKDVDGKIDLRSVDIENKTIISTLINEKRNENFTNDAAASICGLLMKAAKNSINLKKNGKYNEIVATSLPYQFSAGVIKRSSSCNKYQFLNKNAQLAK